MLQAQSEIFLAAKSPPPTPPAPTGEGDGPKADSEKGDGVKAEPSPGPSPEAIAESRLAALATLCQALLSSNRFLYID
jgi:hypothetical protein